MECNVYSTLYQTSNNLPTYRSLTPSTSNGVREQGPRVREVRSIRPPFLVQLVLGTCRQEVERQVGTTSSTHFICEKTSCIINQSLPSLFLSFGSQCWQQAALYKHLQVVRAEVDSIRHPSSSTRTSNGGLQSRSGRTGQEILPFTQKLPAYAPPSCATRTSIGGL